MKDLPARLLCVAVGCAFGAAGLFVTGASVKPPEPARVVAPPPGPPPPPPGLQFSKPVDGLSIAVSGPKEILATDLTKSVTDWDKISFEIYLLNTSSKTLVLSDHAKYLNIDFSVDRRVNKNPWITRRAPALCVLYGAFSPDQIVLLNPGRWTKCTVAPNPMATFNFARGQCSVRATLTSPDPREWRYMRRMTRYDLREMFHRNDVSIWYQPKITSPPFAVTVK